MSLLLETSLGDLVIDLDIEGSLELCKNVLHLATARYYTNTLITPIVPGRTARCGDPVGDGSGGTSIYGWLDSSATSYVASQRRCLADTAGRTLTAAERREKGRVVAMGMVDLKNGESIPNSITSQFCITLADGPEQALDGLSPTSFRSLGVVVEDEQNVLDQINEAYIDPAGRPYADIRIRRALVIHDPFIDERPNGMEAYLDTILTRESGRVLSSPSPERPAEETVARRIRAEDVLMGLQKKKNGEDEDASMNSAEEEAAWNAQVQREKEQEERRADKSRAVVLEMLGDVPDAEMKAPEDVLFLCKLNPETMDEDLELIFSRFDEKVKVEIIRDADTGASLQYAFAEFTSKEAAEEAYLKMDNALVDDRRIKVDFSQSVSKLWDKYNQKMRMPKSFRSEPQPSKQQYRNPPPRNNGSQRGPPQQQQRSHDNQQQHHARRDSEDYRQRPDDSYHRIPDRRDRDGSRRRRDERHNGRTDRDDKSDDDCYNSRPGHHHRSSRHRTKDEKRPSSNRKRDSRREDSSDSEHRRKHHREDDRRSHSSRDKRRPSRRDVSVSDDESHRKRHRRRRSRSPRYRSRSEDSDDHKKPKRRHRSDEEHKRSSKKHKKDHKHRKHEKKSRR